MKKWIVVNESQDKRIYWNEEQNQWTVTRENATEFTNYVNAELVADQEGGWLKECTIIEPPASELNTK